MIYTVLDFDRPPQVSVDVELSECYRINFVQPIDEWMCVCYCRKKRTTSTYKQTTSKFAVVFVLLFKGQAQDRAYQT